MIMDINQPFVTQEQKFKYWEESKHEIQTLRAKVESVEVEKAELVKQNNLLEINLRKTKLELSEWDRSYKP